MHLQCSEPWLRSRCSAPTETPTTAGYYPDSTLSVRNVPAIGGLPSEQILYSYDAWGRLGNVRGNGGILNSTVYSPIGQLAQFNRLNLGAEAYSSYGYDSVTGALLSIKDNAVFDGSGHYVADRTYTRDDAGNITSASTASVLPTPRTQMYCYRYDALRQLTTAWSPADPTPCSTAPTAAGLGGPAPVWLDYTYDMATGNRTSVTSHATNGSTKTATYNYPAAGAAQPHAVTSLSGDAGLGAGAYDTDDAGYFTAMPGKTLTYNENGKLDTITTGTNTQTQIYDATGNLLLRVSTVEGAALFLGDTVLTKKATGTTTYGVRTYSGAKDIPVAERKANTGATGSVVTWLFADVTGTVDTQTVASTGATVQTLRDPFGNPLGGGDAFWEDGNGYLNKPGTTSTGLTTVGARTYSALLGKFLSVDPITDPNKPQQNTGYAYAHNNPLLLPDPTGLAPGMLLSDGCGRSACGVATAKKYASIANPSKAPSSLGKSFKPKLGPSLRPQHQAPSADSDGLSKMLKPLQRAFGDLPVAVSRILTDAMSKVPLARQLANLPATAAGLVVAYYTGASCSAAANGLIVCGGASMNLGGGGTTLGEVFVTTLPTDTVVEQMPELQAHEQRHSAQWAGWGPIYYPIAYWMAATYSQKESGNYWTSNYFENDADLTDGGY